MADREKREKIIKGLEICHVPNDCDECPYNERYEGCGCISTLMSDVLSLLKAQEPRVMGVGDLYGEDMGFYERKGAELLWPVLIARGGPDNDGTVSIIRKDAFEIKADCGLINQTWRMWTTYPTAAQREAVKWE